MVQRRCPHKGADLGRFGEVDGCVLTRSMHGWQFDLETGECLNHADHPITARRSASDRNYIASHIRSIERTHTGRPVRFPVDQEGHRVQSGELRERIHDLRDLWLGVRRLERSVEVHRRVVAIDREREDRDSRRRSRRSAPAAESASVGPATRSFLARAQGDVGTGDQARLARPMTPSSRKSYPAAPTTAAGSVVGGGGEPWSKGSPRSRPAAAGFRRSARAHDDQRRRSEPRRDQPLESHLRTLERASSCSREPHVPAPRRDRARSTAGEPTAAFCFTCASSRSGTPVAPSFRTARVTRRCPRALRPAWLMKTLVDTTDS